ncbi:hypothetical protein GCM10027271_27840 [Saccharopolyspora gloriosae]|uniref:Uncharacterized protein n=1 Tax=Saccharopolyspora gloriosae TaxID=455344 RepID=A0A840NT60_9PSEU|nr:hypothetical protein [Saccharopolyspora gloriosae]MBB5071377.1 hypothetical protein [Saccharopolyspora gloriosae]
MGHSPEPQLHRRVLARLGAATDELAGLLGARGRDRIPHEFLAAPARIDARALCRELDGISAVRALRLPSSFLDELSGAPAPERLPALLREIDRLDRLRELRLPPDAFDDVPLETVDCWRHRALAEWPVSPGERLSLLAALCWCRQAELTHEVLGVLFALVDELHARVAERLRQTGRPARIAGPSGGLAQWEWWPVPDEGLGALLRGADEQHSRARAGRAALHVAYTSDYRQLLSAMLQVLEFRSAAPESWPLLAALGELLGETTRAWGTERFYPPEADVPVRGVVPSAWLSVVVDRHGRVDRSAYELCVLIRLREAVRDGEVTVPGSADPRVGVGDVGECITWPPDAPERIIASGAPPG